MIQNHWYNSLRVQIVLLLTLALLPLGAVAIYQTDRVAKESEHNAELALLALTEQAAQGEEATIERAFGVGRFLATIAGQLIANPALCTSYLEQFADGVESYSVIGVLPKSGILACSSSGGAYDVTQIPILMDAIAAQKRNIVVVQDAPLSGTSVFVVLEPYRIAGRFAGFVTISIPHNGVPDTSQDLTDLGLQELFTFNADGNLLTARGDMQEAVAELPADRLLQDLGSSAGFAFRGQNALGERRTYTVVPISDSSANVLAVWRGSDGVASNATVFVRPTLFPVLMWVASMSVALLSIYQLVLRPISRLRKDMDAFAETRAIAPPARAHSEPSEFQSLKANFARMSHDIVLDEAELENSLREKNVLVKEVHHRVKNNLQLISSIMNMKIRTAQHDETKNVLGRLQDRILSLAMIHRDLYQSQHGGMVNVGTLVAEIVQKSLEVAVTSDADVALSTDIDPVLLFPDQALPLSLLTAEGMTNAMKYLGAQSTERPWLKATLKQSGDTCVLTLANSVGDVKTAESTGLGAQLISAFGIQLGGRIDTDETAESYTLTVTFKVADFEPEARDF
ncbi:sensor histidine kinase [Yoonia sediminilitoris]|uniref:histidine kinase n=1 Tax=Yoonia sediminilitoris TaxID=1286148 RepID=A0A2T6KHD2_9RHOB|nr:sensor histidine kinase [Yoonia sediminilitoris]PUB14924.1 two-component sensor histidine kinase [Yoonia sediminilitoris]RCW95641.1 two-component sensor histidine kinase [Yoonia sediminilitoris]